MKKLRIVPITLILVFSLLLNTTAFTGNEVLNNSSGVTAVEFAQGFVNGLEPDRTLVAGESVNIYDVDDNITGFCVSLLEDNQSSGYVVIKLTDIGPVVEEFTTQNGVGNLYDEISGFDTASSNAPQKKLYGFAPTEYVIPKQQQGAKVFIDYAGNKLSESEFNLKAEDFSREQELSLEAVAEDIGLVGMGGGSVVEESVATGDGETTGDIVDGNSVICDYNTFLANKGTTTSYEFLSGYSRNTIYAQSGVINLTNKYACAVVAILNVASYFKSNGYPSAFLNNSVAATFNRIWDLTETYVTSVSNGVSYGSTYIDKQKPAIETYFSQRGYSVTVNEFASASFNNYRNAINANKPCIFDYGAIFNGSIGGHSVFVAGYIETTGPDYLLVGDGWHTYYRYLNIDSNFSFTYGRAVKMNSLPTSYK